MERLSFLLIDDVATYRDILRQIVQTQPHWFVVGEATNGSEAVQLVLEHAPHVVLMDIDMPVMNGIEATRRIKQLSPETRIILFSGHQDEEFRRESLQSGASFFLVKEDMDATTLPQLIAMLFS
jgi:DNA-binding NarL/FixJ family response regulator